jgi:hypothetical protein
LINGAPRSILAMWAFFLRGIATVTLTEPTTLHFNLSPHLSHPHPFEHIILTSSKKKRMQLHIACRHKNSSHLTKFLVNTIHIYGYKIIYYKNTFRN